MGPESLQRYFFETPDQWRSGVRQNWIMSDSGLQPPHRFEPRVLDGIHPSDYLASLAYDPAGTLCWVREHTFEYVRNVDGKPFVCARFQMPVDPNEWRIETTIAGTGLIWLLLRPIGVAEPLRLIGFSTDSFQPCVSTVSDWEIVAITRAKRDGLYAVARINQRLWVVSISNTGRVRSLVELLSMQCVAIAAIPGMDAVVILDCKSDDLSCEDRVVWRVLLLDLSCSCDQDKLETQEVFRYERKVFPCCDDASDFVPGDIVVDCSQTIYVSNLQSGEIFALGMDGETRGFWCCLFNDCTLPLVSFVAAQQLVVSGAAGILRLEDIAETEFKSGSDSVKSTFLTPALVSPDEVVRGWSRADITIDLADQLAIEVRVAYTSDRVRIKQIIEMTQDKTLTDTSRLGQLEDWLPWDQERTFVFHGEQWPTGGPLRFPLHGIDATHVWLMIRLYASDHRPIPTLKTLQVLYPNISYSKYLPAVFQENSTGAQHLRNLMTVIESVFGEQDKELSQLPEKLDPRTAPSEWLPYLLRWLGLPIASELDTKAQRALLIAAPELLRWRGSLKALNDLLVLLVGSEFRLFDLGAGPAPWSLPHGTHRNYGARLGQDTLVFCAPQPGFSPGQQAILGSSPLGYTTLRTTELYKRRNGLIQIFVASKHSDSTRIKFLLKRYLPYFVPAHCRYQLHLVDSDSLPTPRKLSSAVLFNAPGISRLGNTLVIGSSHLPGGNISKTGISMLSRDTVMNSGDYLT